MVVTLGTRSSQIAGFAKLFRTLLSSASLTLVASLTVGANSTWTRQCISDHQKRFGKRRYSRLLQGNCWQDCDLCREARGGSLRCGTFDMIPVWRLSAPDTTVLITMCRAYQGLSAGLLRQATYTTARLGTFRYDGLLKCLFRSSTIGFCYE